MEETILTAKDLKFRYDPEQPDYALNGVSAEVKRGEFVAVLGHNGSGKSTFAKHCNAVLLPRTGTVTVDGMNTKDEDKLFEIRQCAGMVFQNPDNQLVATVVEEDIAFGPENMGVPPKEIRMRVDEALDAVRMKEFAAYTPSKLSGGQKQRTAIARALITNPRILLADEPTGALDSKAATNLLKQLREINQTGQTILMVTHSNVAASYADRVMFIKDGEVFHQIYRGDMTRSALLDKICDAVTVLMRGGEDSES